MTRYVALLRAVNVGGTGRLPMSDLRRLCADAGFADTRTYIQSGNAVFSSALGPAAVKHALEARLLAHAGKPVGLCLRDGAQMAAVLAANPFADREPRFTQVIFLEAPPQAYALERATGRRGEDMAVGAREIYVHYPMGQGQSRLRIPDAAEGTARNLNTVAKLAQMVSGA